MKKQSIPFDKKKPSDYVKEIQAERLEDFLNFLHSERFQKFVEETTEAHSALVDAAFVRPFLLLPIGFRRL